MNRSYFRCSSEFGTMGENEDQFCCPGGIAYCPKNQHVIVTEEHNHRVHILNRHLEHVTMFGRKGDGQGEFNHPTGVAVDHNGNIYVADSCNHRIQITDAYGRFIHQFGTEGHDLTQFKRPCGLAVNENNHTCVCDSANFAIKMFTSTGDLVKMFGCQGTIPGKFTSEPRGISLTRDGCFVINDIDGDIHIFDSSYRFIRKLEKGKNFIAAWSVASNFKDNTIVVVDSIEGRIVMVQPDGEMVTTFGSKGKAPGEMMSPWDAIVSPEGEVYVCDFGAHKVLRYSS